MRVWGELIERSFAHTLETGGMRHTHWDSIPTPLGPPEDLLGLLAAIEIGQLDDRQTIIWENCNLNLAVVLQSDSAE
jgi:hypothetical protein